MPVDQPLLRVARSLDSARNLPPGRSPDDAVEFLQYLSSQAHLQEIYFQWRPFLRDADDDMVMELAFAAGCEHIITFNAADCRGTEQIGITALSPREFLNLIRTRT